MALTKKQRKAISEEMLLLGFNDNNQDFNSDLHEAASRRLDEIFEREKIEEPWFDIPGAEDEFLGAFKAGFWDQTHTYERIELHARLRAAHELVDEFLTKETDAATRRRFLSILSLTTVKSENAKLNKPMEERCQIYKAAYKARARRILKSSRKWPKKQG